MAVQNGVANSGLKLYNKMRRVANSINRVIAIKKYKSTNAEFKLCETTLDGFTKSYALKNKTVIDEKSFMRLNKSKIIKFIEERTMYYDT